MRIRRGVAFLLAIICLLGVSENAIVQANLMVGTVASVDIEEEEKEDVLGNKIAIRSIIKNSNDGVTVSWDKVEDAEYQIMINTEIIDVKENFITSKQIINEEYFYKVRYKVGDKYSLWSDTKSFVCEENDLKINKNQLELLPFISGSAYGTKDGKKEWHDFANEGGNVYSINLDSPIEKLKLSLNNKIKNIDIKYRAFILEDNEWTEWKSENEEVGESDKTISSIDIRYEDNEEEIFIKYSTIDTENIQSPFYNNSEVYDSPESLDPIKGVKISVDVDYEVLANDDTWKSGTTKEIRGFYEIPEGKTLTIEPNVKINFSNDVGEKAGFIVKGNLVINGTDANKVEINSLINDLDIDIKYSGSVKAKNLIVKSNELNDNSIINAYGNIELSKYELLSVNSKAISKGIVFNQDRFNNKNNINSVQSGKISNFNQGIYINTTQDGVLISGNTIEKNNTGIVIDSNDYTKNDNNINIKNNKINNNQSALIINQYSYLKTKAFKTINIEENTISDNSIRGIGLFVDSLNNINIKKNIISGTNVNKDKKDQTGNELIGGPIVLEKAVIDEDSNNLLESINSEINKNTLTGNNYDTLILDRVSLAETTQVTIKKGAYIPIISDYLRHIKILC